MASNDQKIKSQICELWVCRWRLPVILNDNVLNKIIKNINQFGGHMFLRWMGQKKQEKSGFYQCWWAVLETQLKQRQKGGKWFKRYLATRTCQQEGRGTYDTRFLDRWVDNNYLIWRKSVPQKLSSRLMVYLILSHILSELIISMNTHPFSICD